MDEAEAVLLLARELTTRNGGHPLCGPKQARELARVSRSTLARAYRSGDLAVSRPGRGKRRLVVISILRLAEWIYREERRR